jgi:5-methylcytosine-specific restriction protein B
MNKEQNIIKTDDALNIILYGPPGTGKTYKTIDKAVEIITGNMSNDHEENKKTFEELRKNKQIDFVTFHQSYSYEDFVEGIKPKIDSENTENEESDDSNIGDIKYEKTKGIFYDINSLALESYKSSKVSDSTDEFVYNKDDLNDVIFYKMSLGNTQLGEDDDIYKYCIKNNCIGLGWGGSLDYTNANSEKEIRDVMEKEKVDVRRYELFAVKCFKTWMRKGDIVFISNGNYACRAIGKIESNYYYESNNDIRYHHFRKVKWILKDVNIPVNELYGRIFSQQTIYQMFTYLVKKDFFLRFKSGKKNEHDKYVLIIDEINRGNISNIFGELISLIEKDKRFGAKEELTVKLPYSKTDFTVAPNLYLVGTMNSADRSVEALDTALRRRFSFVEMVPDPEVIVKVNESTTIESINIVDVYKKLNERIEKLLDRDHLIGHSYFLNIKSLSDLKLSFANCIIPLLQEYFYGDYGKIGLILGTGFINVDENNKNLFAKFVDTNDLSEILEKKIFRIVNVIEMDDDKFKEALTLLLN